MTYRERDRQLVIARRGIVRVAGRSSMSAATEPPDATGRVAIRILVDGSIMELEVNGDTMGTVRLAPHRPGDRSVVISVEGGETLVRGIEVWPLRPPSSPE